MMPHLEPALPKAHSEPGADYFLFNDKAKVSVDVWDFSNDEDGAKKSPCKSWG